MMFVIGHAAFAASRGYKIEGTVVEAGSENPVPGAAVRLGEDYLWSITDIDGTFSFSNVQPGEWTVEVSCLGYQTVVQHVKVGGNVNDIVIVLRESSLALDEVLVTAKRTDDLNTSHSLGRDALNHLQLTNPTDIMSLLPGGKTVNPDLTSQNAFSLREGGSSTGNAAFGTAVEVDGVRLGGNASFGSMGGTDTRNISVDNIESIEIMTGVPSAEYGDMNAGIVKINTRKGRTPTHISFSVNPRTYQTSVSKGVDLQKNKGVLNLSAEWARSVKKLISPYTSAKVLL